MHQELRQHPQGCFLWAEMAYYTTKETGKVSERLES